MGRFRKGAGGKRLRVEPLEDRRLLAATPIITEFMASNSATLLDGNGQELDTRLEGEATATAGTRVLLATEAVSRSA